MKRVLLGTSCPLFLAGPTFGQAPAIALFADLGATDCTLHDITQSQIQVYVFHLWTHGGSMGAEFMVIPFGGADLTYIGETVTAPFLHIGNSQVGIEIAFGSCQSVTPLLILTINYFGNGLSATCSTLLVRPHPGRGNLGVWDCTEPYPKLLPANGICIWINPDQTCGCPLPSPGGRPCPDPVPVEEHTWGQIKALYLDG